MAIAPLNEQKRIADKLNKLFTRIDDCRNQLDQVPLILKHLRQSILNAAVSGELTRDWVYTSNPKPWENLLIGNLLVEKPRNGYSPRAVEFETQTRSLSLTATTSGRFNPKHLKYIDKMIPEDSYLWLEPDDILIQRANTLEYVGVSAIYNGPSKGYIYPDLMMKCRANNKVQTKFLHYLLLSDNVRSYFRKNATGTSGNMPKINQQTIISAPVWVPSIDEQQEIINRVEVFFAYADHLESLYRTACDQIERLIPALLDKAFRGELVPQDLNDEPASILLEKIKAEKIRMESEQKTERTARSSIRQTPKALMKQPSDYLEALRSAFKASDAPINARQLFNQAGFNPEDVVPFYEALRVAPEIRAAFPRAQRSQQLQNNTVKITNQPPSENRRFRLIELWLEDFKNLADYTVRFDPTHSIDVVLGWNGTGKSNLFEAIVIIFRDLSKWHEKNQWPKIPMKGSISPLR